MPRRNRFGVKLIAVLVAVAACVGIGLTLVGTSGTPAKRPALQGNGSVDEAWLTGAAPGDHLTLTRDGTALTVPGASDTADPLGSLIIRNLTPGTGYRWDDETTAQTTAPFTVLAPGHDPGTDSALYTNQPMHEGLNYITMRDGIRLAATVRYPYGGSCSATSPCPTVIEYSGYNVAGPTDPIPVFISKALHTTCTDCGNQKLLPDTSTAVGSVLARVSGFATVSLQMRGTGCSGGAFDLFGYPSDYDAYDAIEIVAHQSWVAHHKVGMVGISYSGLSQFPAAGTDPPGLAAIAPMSPTDDLFSTGYPGGIYNDGFAASWIKQRIDDAKPAALYRDGHLVRLATAAVADVGQPWTYYEIDAELAAGKGGSSTCLANQALHGQSESLATLVGPKLVAPGTGVGARSIPVRSAGRWSTGPPMSRCRSSSPAPSRTSRPDRSGRHSSMPFRRRRRCSPTWSTAGTSTRPIPRPSAAGSSSSTSMSPTRSRPTPNSLDAIFLGQVHRLRRRRLEPGAAAGDPVHPGGERGRGPGRVRGPDPPRAGPLRQRRRTCRARGHRVHLRCRLLQLATGRHGRDPLVRRRRIARVGPGDHLGRPRSPWTRRCGPRRACRPAATPGSADPDWDWTPVPAADGIAFQTAPFGQPTTIVGPATLDLWVKASAPVEDFQATITEVRPSTAQEEYVTSGFLRSSNQVDAADSTALFTDPTYQPGQAKRAVAELVLVGEDPDRPHRPHLPAGHRARVVISAPGGDRPVWEFDTLDTGQQATVGLGGHAPSALVVNVVGGVQATTALPACDSLRGEPCRAYQPEGNQTG